MFQLKDILEGWRNDLFPANRLKEVITKVSNERLAICKSCIGYDESGKGCVVSFTQPCCNKNVIVGEIEGVKVLGCGCPLRKKTKCLSCECPAKKWLAVVTDEEEEKFKLIDDGK